MRPVDLAAPPSLDQAHACLAGSDMFLGGQEESEADGDMGAVRIGKRHVVIEQRGHLVKVGSHRCSPKHCRRCDR